MGSQRKNSKGKTVGVCSLKTGIHASNASEIEAIPNELKVGYEITGIKRREEWNLMRESMRHNTSPSLEIAQSSAKITEIDLILRADSLFGILCTPAKKMSITEIGTKYEQALGRINASVESTPGTKREAEDKLDNARARLMNGAEMERALVNYDKIIDKTVATIR
jgi:hypothetical protein